jgi:hypothetical protein
VAVCVCLLVCKTNEMERADVGPWFMFISFPRLRSFGFNMSIHQSINQSINQSTNQSNALKCNAKLGGGKEARIVGACPRPRGQSIAFIQGFGLSSRAPRYISVNHLKASGLDLAVLDVCVVRNLLVDVNNL